MDGYLGQAPGLGQRSVFRFVALAGQQIFAGRDATGLVLNYTPGVATIVVVGGLVLSAPDYVAQDGSTLTIASPLPAGKEVLVLVDSAWNPANVHTVAEAEAKFTRKRNRVVNPGMRISQEYGNSALSFGAGSVYAVDNFSAYVGSVAGATGTVQQIAKPTPGGSPNRLRITTLSATANVQPTDNAAIGFAIEGTDTVDLLWGTPSAKPVTIRFGLCVSLPGVYALSVRNHAATRSYIVPVVIAANEVNTDVLRVITVPGDTTGTWVKDTTGRGLTVSLVSMCGPTFQGAANAWLGGNYVAPANILNTFATAGATTELFDVGLYEGAVAPSFELPDVTEDLRKCQRYWQWAPALTGASNEGTSVTRVNLSGTLPISMRVVPTVALVLADNALIRQNVSFITPTAVTGSTSRNSVTLGFEVPAMPGNINVALLAQDRVSLNARL